MKRGDIIKIYKDPLTQKQLEGTARLILKVSEDAYFEMWDVQFTKKKGNNIVRRVIRKQ